MPEQWLSPKEAGKLLNVSAWVIRNLVRQGKLEGVKLGHRTVRVRMVEEEVVGDAENNLAVPEELRRGPSGS